MVEKILDRKKVGRKTLYFVKWENYDETQNTWEPASNLQNVKKMVLEFDKQFDLSTTVNQGSTYISNGSALIVPQSLTPEISFPANNKVPISATSKAIKKSFLKMGAKETSPAKPTILKKLGRQKKTAVPEKEEEPVIDEYEQ